MTAMGSRLVLGLKGSASLKGKTLTLTAVNPDVKDGRETEIVLRGATAASAKAWVVAENDMHAHNTLGEPEVVKTRQRRLACGGFVTVYVSAGIGDED